MRRNRSHAFALSELIISTAIFSTVSAGLVMGFVSLKRNYAATADFATNHADQMRISDYVALDMRRAVKVEPIKVNDVNVYIPCYYDSTAARSPQTPLLDGKGGVYYGSPTCSVKIRYYLEGSIIYRKHGDDTPEVLARDVEDFELRLVAEQDPKFQGKVVITSVKFKPTFKSSGASAEVNNATEFHNKTLLRNKDLN